MKLNKIIYLSFLIILLGAISLVAVFFIFKESRQASKVNVGKFVLQEYENKSLILETEKPNEVPVANAPIASTKVPKKGKLMVPVLYYHYIKAAAPGEKLPHLYLKPEIFENQILALRDLSYQTIFAKDLAEAVYVGNHFQEKVAALTFDDGYEDFYTTVYPLLKKYGMKATVFVIVNAVDQPGYLTTYQIKEMAKSGYVEIGSHTLNHPNLKESTAQQAQIEINDSKVALEKMIGEPIRTFCYPYGFFRSDEMPLVAKSGYWGAYSTYPGITHSKSMLFSILRLRPMERQNDEFKQWIISLENSVKVATEPIKNP